MTKLPKLTLPSFLVRNFASYTRLNQVNQFAQFAFSIVLNLIMQNKPNLCLFWAVSGDCEEKQTQTNPIQTQNKAIFNPPAALQSQNKPNSNPISSRSRHSFTQCGSRRPKFTRHSFCEGGPPAEIRNSARQKKTNNEVAKQKYHEREKRHKPNPSPNKPIRIQREELFFRGQHRARDYLHPN